MEEITKEMALRRFQTAAARKRECLRRLEQRMKEKYEAQTGLPANYFFAM